MLDNLKVNGLCRTCMCEMCITDHTDQWTAEEMQILEKFFDLKVRTLPFLLLSTLHTVCIV